MSGNTDDPVGKAKSINRDIKNGCPIDDRPVVIRRQYGMTQVCINTRGCSKGLAGHCTFCNYRHGKGLDGSELEGVIQTIKDSVIPGDHSLLIGCSGSILDKEEFQPSHLAYILESMNDVDVKTIILETRLDTITPDSLELIRMHSRHQADVEFGLESSDPDVLRYSLNKSINVNDVEEKIRLIHRYGFTATANVLIGAPLLTKNEQIDDAVRTINWAKERGADNIVLFPMNVRAYTLLERMYRHGSYEMIDHRMILITLSRLEPRILSSVSLSWSDPNQTDDEFIIAYPSGYNLTLMDLYKRIMDEKNGKERRDLILSYLQTNPYTLHSEQDGRPLDERLMRSLESIEPDLDISSIFA